MSRTVLYPEGSAQLNAIVPEPVKAALRELALSRRQSISQVVTFILEQYLHRGGLVPNEKRN